jgi:hypothetical protein
MFPLFLDRWLRSRKAAHLPTPEPIQRRASERQASGRTTFCEVIMLPASVPALVIIRDFSTGGIGLLCRQAVAVGTFIALKIDGANGAEHLLRARVVHATVLGNQWLIGCVLTAPLRPEDVAALLSTPFTAAGADTRT